MIRVVVADDHEMFREMLRIALPRAGDLEVAGEAADGEDVLVVVDRVRPDVVLLDYQMPQVGNFTALVEKIRASRNTPQVVVLSGFGSLAVAERAAAGGARGYVLKSTRLAAVADSVRTVAKGGVWIDSHLERKIFDVFQRRTGESDGEVNGLSGLTRREREVLSCVAEGSSNQQIALKLGISEQTVKTHLTRIFAKLEVKSRLAAALAFYGKTSQQPDGLAASG